MEIIALYPGQGSQQRGMGLSLLEASAAVRHLFALVSDIAQIDIRSLLADDSERDLTRYAQLAITLVNRSAHLFLKEAGVSFRAHSGFSLGELSAYAASGIISDNTLFQIIVRRMALMDDMSRKAAEAHGELVMAAVIGLDFSTIETLLVEEYITDLFAANDNAPTQVVLSGTSSSLEKARKILLGSGASRIVPLNVSGPFHTPFMAEATAPFARYLDSLPFFDPREMVVSSIDGTVVANAVQARANLARQLARPVRWTAAMRALDALDIPFGEVGWGSVLTGLCKHNKSTQPCVGLADSEAMGRLHHE